MKRIRLEYMLSPYSIVSVNLPEYTNTLLCDIKLSAILKW